MIRSECLSRVAVVVVIAALLGAPLRQMALAQSSSSATNHESSRGVSIQLSGITASAGPNGVLIEWSTSFELNNLGFNVYRLQNGQSIQLNRSLLRGSALMLGEGKPLYGGKSYSFFDGRGSADSEYYIEDINLAGKSTFHDPIKPNWNPNLPKRESLSILGAGAAAQPTQVEYPGVAQSPATQSVTGSIDEQWRIAALPPGQVLKVAVKQEGWYHLTQAQLAAAGFNVSGDAQNLRLFVGGRELAIRVSRASGPLGPNDYVEFYGTGIDIQSTDTRMYYLVNDSQPGLRITILGELTPSSTLGAVSPSFAWPSKGDTTYQWFGGITRDVAGGASTEKVQRNENSQNETAADLSNPATGDVPPAVDTAASCGASQRDISSTVKEGSQSRVSSLKSQTKTASQVSSLKPQSPTAFVRKRGSSPTVRKGSSVRRSRPGSSRARFQRKRHRPTIARLAHRHRNHAAASETSAVSPNFTYTARRKDRKNYITLLLNGGDVENWFGDVLTNSNHANQTLTIHNVEPSAAGPAQLQVALQGISQINHNVSIFFNGTLLGSIFFSGLNHAVQTFPIPVSSILDGTNSVQIVPDSSSGAIFADYVQLTYPHSFKALNNSLRFNLRYSQGASIDGFTDPNTRILDITNPLAVSEVRAIVQANGCCYTLKVPAFDNHTKGMRTLWAVPSTQQDQPVSLTLNQPSTWNASANGASLVIISHKDFIPSLTKVMPPSSLSLVQQRLNQNYTVATIDIEDLYDEFSYGMHSPQAITDFFARARDQVNGWSTKPQYLLLIGDASLDPRNYYGLAAPPDPGSFDFVPTKMIDTEFMETCSDDELVDLNGDGIADIPIGRLPARTAAEADLMISKIVNFTPQNPQTAVMVADRNDDGYYFSFENANDEVANIVQSLLPGTTIQKVYRRLEKTTLTGNISADSTSTTVTGTGTHFTTEVLVGNQINGNGVELGFVSSISSDTSLNLTTNAIATYSGAYGKQSDSSANSNIVNQINQGVAVVNYSGHGNVDIWRGALLTAPQARNLTNGNLLPLVAVNDCLNGYFDDPSLEGIAEALMKAPNGGAIAAFASSGETIPDGQHEMAKALYQLLYGPQPIAIGDAVIQAKAGPMVDSDVRRTWILLGDPTLKIR